MSRLTRQEAARFLTEHGYPIAAGTMAKQAVMGTGCPYRLWNARAVYDSEELLNWAASRIGPKIRNTAEVRNGRVTSVGLAGQLSELTDAPAERESR